MGVAYREREKRTGERGIKKPTPISKRGRLKMICEGRSAVPASAQSEGQAAKA